MARAKAGAGHAVFISYASADRDAANRICTALEAAGVRCWIAPRDGKAGASYAAFLVDAIAACKVVLLVFSRASNASDAVLNELEIAANRKRTIVPVRLEAFEPTGAAEFYLRRRHWFDAVSALEPRLADLVAAVNDALRPKRAPRAVALAAPAPRGNLPPALTSFVGRQTDVAGVGALLGASAVVTLWGPGGVGKTRLALEAARHGEHAFREGAWFIDLAPLPPEGPVAASIAAVLAVRHDAIRPIEETLGAALAGRELLLVLDNCEHVLGGVARIVARIVAAAPGVRVLCTSREPLGVDGERVVPVAPLDVDAGGAAMQLFAERARAAGADAAALRAPLVAEICRKVDGIPFAIELAAARTRSMPLDEIARSLDARLRVLTGGSRIAGVRQQTLRGTLDWSFGLLRPPEADAFVRAAVFAGGFTARAFSAVLGPERDAWEWNDLLRALVEKSLVTHDARGSRYGLLETTREYALERYAEHPDNGALRRRHAEYYLAQTADAVRAWRSATSDEALSTVVEDGANIDAALAWSLFARGDVLLGARLAAAMGIVWEFVGAYQTGFRALSAALDSLPADARDDDIANVLIALSALRLRTADYRAALVAARRALPLAVRAADGAGEARASWLIGTSARRLGEPAEARRALERGAELYRHAGDGRGLTACLAELAFIAGQHGDRARARRVYGEIADICATRGDVRDEGYARLNVAEHTFADGDTGAAIAIARDMLARARSAGVPALFPYLRYNLAAYLLAAGQVAEARAQLGDILAGIHGDEDAQWAVLALGAVALCEVRAGRVESAAVLYAYVAPAAGAHLDGLDPAEAYVARQLAEAFADVTPPDARPNIAELVRLGRDVLVQGEERRAAQTDLSAV